ncbi:uncharacterized protein A4U43_C01F25750 [Asparagus officinalis]|uniref:Uncharacterized protein n=1 Tax=Asparagus officinalis TaxID=4686 RepID=A0A5P1FTZ1_ASPOF|nr:uncharacterized protein A4U43_C01F25750 [Asparagus officinalis]
MTIWGRRSRRPIRSPVVKIARLSRSPPRSVTVVVVDLLIVVVTEISCSIYDNLGTEIATANQISGGEDCEIKQISTEICDSSSGRLVDSAQTCSMLTMIEGQSNRCEYTDNKVKSGSPVVDFWRPVVDSDERSPSTATAELKELLLASPLKARFCADFDDGGAGG